MLRLDFLSPLPPVRSGIADYSVDLLPHLAERADVRVLRLGGQEVSDEVVARWRPVPVAAAPEEGRLALYQMGNNRFHLGVWEAAMRRPGLLTLHDLVLHHLLLGRTLGEREFEPYLAALAADHGWIGEVVARPPRFGAYSEIAPFVLPAHRTLLRRQRGVLVHSGWAAAQLAEADPELRVRAVPMGVPLPALPPAESGRELRRRLGIPPEALLLGSFGFQTPIKRAGTAIAALAGPELAGVHLLIGGQAAAVLDLAGDARRAGVAERVHLLGYLDYDAFLAAIAATDVCLNLRYPTAGETSASLLRVLAMGRPAIVSDYAQFAELPPEVALRVPLGEDEVPALRAALAMLGREPARRRAMGEQARRHVEREHAPAAAASAVIAAADTWREAEPLPPRPASAPPTTSLVWRALAGELEVEGAQAPWSPGERRRLRLRLVNRSPAVWLAGRSGAGGVAIEVTLWRGSRGASGGRDESQRSAGELAADRPWIPLPRDLAPGETMVLEIEVRRPLGPGRLRLEPHVIGAGGFAILGGPVWESELPPS